MAIILLFRLSTTALVTPVEAMQNVAELSLRHGGVQVRHNLQR